MAWSKGWWAKGVEQCRGESRRLSQIPEVSVQIWFSTVCMSFPFTFVLQRIGKIWLGKWCCFAFGNVTEFICNPQLLCLNDNNGKCWWSCSLMPEWEVLVMSTQGVWDSLSHNILPDYESYHCLPLKISLVPFSLSAQSLSSLCWDVPGSLSSKTFCLQVYKTCSLWTVWV